MFTPEVRPAVCKTYAIAHTAILLFLSNGEVGHRVQENRYLSPLRLVRLAQRRLRDLDRTLSARNLHAKRCWGKGRGRIGPQGQ